MVGRGSCRCRCGLRWRCGDVDSARPSRPWRHRCGRWSRAVGRGHTRSSPHAVRSVVERPPIRAPRGPGQGHPQGNRLLSSNLPCLRCTRALLFALRVEGPPDSALTTHIGGAMMKTLRRVGVNMAWVPSLLLVASLAQAQVPPQPPASPPVYPPQAPPQASVPQSGVAQPGAPPPAMPQWGVMQPGAGQQGLPQPGGAPPGSPSPGVPQSGGVAPMAPAPGAPPPLSLGAAPQAPVAQASEPLGSGAAASEPMTDHDSRRGACGRHGFRPRDGTPHCARVDHAGRAELRHGAGSRHPILVPAKYRRGLRCRDRLVVRVDQHDDGRNHDVDRPTVPIRSRVPRGPPSGSLSRQTLLVSHHSGDVGRLHERDGQGDGRRAGPVPRRLRIPARGANGRGNSLRIHRRAAAGAPGDRGPPLAVRPVQLVSRERLVVDRAMVAWDHRRTASLVHFYRQYSGHVLLLKSRFGCGFSGAGHRLRAA